MAGNIKGITIKIGGDTKEFQKSLTSADKAIKKTQSALKDINRLLKFNPKNTELLQQKQRTLAEAINKTKDKLKLLKEEQKKAAQALKDGKIGQEEYDALQREIVETESKLKNLQKQYKKFGSVAKQKIQEVGKEMKEFGGKVTEVGESLTKNVTGPIAAVAGASIAAFKQVDDGYDEMIKKTGATGEEAEKLREILNSVATNVPTDFETAGQAIGEVSTRFNLTGQELEDLSTLFIKFADLNNTDVSTSIDKVQKGLAAFGLGTEDAGALLDRLNKTAQDSGISVDKLADGIVNNSAAFKELGLDIDESVTFMGKIEKSGVNVDTVMTGMRRALKYAAKEGKPLNEVLGDLQDTIQNGTGSIEDMDAAYEIFGKSGDKLYEAVKNGSLDFQDLATSVEDAGGSVEETFEETQDPLDEFKETMNKLKIAASELAKPLVEMLAPAMEKLAEFIGKLQEKWAALTPEQQAMIEKVALIIAAVGPLLIILGNIITVVGTVITVIGALATPIGIVIAIIGLLVAAGIWLYKHWDDLKGWCEEIWEAIKEFITNVVKSIKDGIVKWFTAVYKFWTNIWNKVKNFFVNAWNAIKSKASAAATAVRDAIMNPINRIYTFWTNIWNKVKTFFSNIWGVMKTAASNGINGVSTTISNKLNTIKSTWSTAWNAVKSTVSTVFDTIKSTISNKLSAAKTVVSNFVSGVKTLLSSISDKIQAVINKATGAQNAGNNLKGSQSIVGEPTLNMNNEVLAYNPNVTSILSLLETYLPKIAQPSDVVLDTGTLVGATAPAMNRALGQLSIRENRR